MTTLELSCRCGQTGFTLSPGTLPKGRRLVCYCTDCQRQAVMFGIEDRLLPGRGTEIFQTSPSRLTVLTGRDTLRCLRLTERGPLRWYASCCDTPVGATVPMGSVPFVGITAGFLAPPARRDETLGPITAAVYREEAGPGAAPQPKHGVKAVIAGNLWRILGAVLRGDTVSPFFDGKAPISEPREVWREDTPA